MLPEPVISRWRRLWRRRLRRRPLLPFLLAATLGIDLVATQLDYDLPIGWLELAFLGFVIGQLSLLGVWNASRRFGVLPRVLGSALIGSPLLYLLEVLLPDPAGTAASFGVGMWGFSMVTAAVVESLALSWRRGLRRRVRRRYSIGILLVAMTVVSLAIVAGQRGRWDIFLSGTVLLAVGLELLLLLIAITLSKLIQRAWALATAYVALAVVLLLALGGGAGPPILTWSHHVGWLLCFGGWLAALRVRGVTRVPRASSESAPTKLDVVA